MSEDYDVTMKRSRFLRLWFGLFWTGILIGYIVGAATTVVFR